MTKVQAKEDITKQQRFGQKSGMTPRSRKFFTTQFGPGMTPRSRKFFTTQFGLKQIIDFRDNFIHIFS